MSFKEWLPITKRNRIALFLALASLVMFVTWNCLPYYEEADEPPEGTIAAMAWPQILSPENYLNVFSSPDVDGFLMITAYTGIILGGLLVLLTVPLWQILHASNFVRLPLAVLNLIGGAVMLWHLHDAEQYDPAPYWIPAILLMSLSMLSLSAAFFIFKNELALRETRSHGMLPREV